MPNPRRQARSAGPSWTPETTQDDELEALRQHRHPRWMPPGYQPGDAVHVHDLIAARDALNAARLEFCARHDMLDEQGRIDWHKFGAVIRE